MMAPRTHPFDLVSRVLTERLRGRTASDELQARLRCQGTAWTRLIGIASAEYVLPALAAALSELDLIRSLDDDLGAFLGAVHSANMERNSELRGELSAAVGVLNEVGIEPVLLKGATRLVEELYPDHGWRMLRDLDLLVPKTALTSATKALEAAGFGPCGSAGAFRRPGGACQIDLHTEPLCGPRGSRLLPAEKVKEKARALTFGKARVWIPSLEHQLVHLIGHSQMRHFGHAFGRISLSDRLEAAALVRWSPLEPDWNAVKAHFNSARCYRPLLTFLLVLNEDGWWAISVREKIDSMMILQQRRITLQARSKILSYLGSQIGVWISLVGSQREQSATGERALSSSLKRLLLQRGGMAGLVRAVRSRQRHLLHAAPHASWLVLQESFEICKACVSGGL